VLFRGLSDNPHGTGEAILSCFDKIKRSKRTESVNAPVSAPYLLLYDLEPDPSGAVGQGSLEREGGMPNGDARVNTLHGTDGQEVLDGVTMCHLDWRDRSGCFTLMNIKSHDGLITV
jgi:hypothetical protein